MPEITKEELELINKHTRRELKADEVYTFPLILCTNQVDRDFERFDDSALYKLAKLYVGKTVILKAKAETTISGGIPSLRSALIRTLGGAYSNTSKIYTNDDGYAYLCNLQDSNNRDYFFYDPSGRGEPAINIGGFIVPVVHVPNSVMASTAAASNKTKMPFIIGDLHEAVRIFDRRQMSIAASNSATISYTEGTGNDAVTHTVSAFQNGMTFLRAYLRADFKQVDADSWINGAITA